MNITKDLFEYINIVRNTFQSPNFSLKIEPQGKIYFLIEGIIDNCAILLKSIAEAEKNIEAINKSKFSFNLLSFNTDFAIQRLSSEDKQSCNEC